MGMFVSKKVIAFVVLVFVLTAGVIVFVAQKNEPNNKIEAVKDVSPKIYTIGLSVEGRKIESYTYGTGTNNLIFVGGIHGGYEWNSVLLAYKFMDYLSLNPEFIPSNISVTVIPSVNPDGVFKVVGKEGRFTAADISTKISTIPGRVNANNVDLNRNFDCKWKSEAVWQNKKIGAGTSAFSEPEAQAIKKIVSENNPSAVVFWHSQSNTVYGSECKDGILPETLKLMSLYSKASGYQVAKTFDNYEVTGDASDWLASIKIPAITVELKTHETIEWEQNKAGIEELFKYYSK